MRRSQVQVVVWRQGPGGRDYLLLRRAPGEGGFWQSVTGGIDAGESPSAAALRELTEETGLEGRLRPTGIKHQFHWYGLAFDEAIFSFEAAPGPVRLLDDEHVESRWCSLGEALWLLYWPANRRHLVMVDRLLQETSTDPAA